MGAPSALAAPRRRRGRLRQVISLRLPDELYDRLIRLAAQRPRRDVSVLMREMLQAEADRADSCSANGAQ